MRRRLLAGAFAIWSAMAPAVTANPLLDQEIVRAMSVPDYAAVVRGSQDVNARDSLGQTPLHIAASVGSPEHLAVLLRAGADINARDDADWTPLHDAAAYGRPENVAALIKAGAAIDAQDDNGSSSLHFAVLSAAVDNIKVLIEASANTDIQDQAGNSALILAAKSGLPGIASTLIEAGANVRLRNLAGDTALHEARDANVVSLLIGADADVNAVNKEGVTPLIRAASEASIRDISGHLNSLIGAGADVNARDPTGQAALHWVALFGTDEQVMLLLDAGASGKVRWKPEGLGPTHPGWTPFDLAGGNPRVRGSSAYLALMAAQYR